MNDESKLRFDLLLPEPAARQSIEYITNYEFGKFCNRYVPTMQGSESERIHQCAVANDWEEGLDYKVGHRSIWLSGRWTSCG
jgi:chitin synthase